MRSPGRTADALRKRWWSLSGHSLNIGISFPPPHPLCVCACVNKCCKFSCKISLLTFIILSHASKTVLNLILTTLKSPLSTLGNADFQFGVFLFFFHLILTVSQPACLTAGGVSFFPHFFSPSRARAEVNVGNCKTQNFFFFCLRALFVPCFVAGGGEKGGGGVVPRAQRRPGGPSPALVRCAPSEEGAGSSPRWMGTRINWYRVTEGVTLVIHERLIPTQTLQLK